MMAERTVAAPTPGPDREAQDAPELEALLRIIKENPKFPAFADNIRELLDILDNPYRPVFEISRVILRDVSLSTAILRVVNSFYFQAHQRKVHTVSSAVMLLGFNEIRDLAVGLKLLDHFKPSSSLNQVKQLTLLSFFMALTAQELAKLNRRFEAEEIFLTALLYNFGELAAAYYFPEQYQQVQKLSREGQEDPAAAFRRVFQVSLDELGLAVLKTWNLPGDLLERLRELKREDPEEFRQERPLRRLFQGIQKLSGLLVSEGGAGEKWQRQEERLARSLGIHPQVVSRTLAACTSRLEEMARVLHLNLKPLRPKAEGAAAKPGTPDKTPAGVEDREAAGTGPPTSDAPQDLECLQRRLQIMEEIHQAIAAQAPIFQILMMVLEGIWQGGGFDRVAFCLVDRHRTQVSGRFGLGAGIDEVVPLLDAPVQDPHHALALALQQGREVLLDAAVPVERRLLPGEVWQANRAQVVLLSPLVIDGKPVAVIYADRRAEAPRLSEAHRQTVRTFRDLAIIALRQSAQRAAGKGVV